MPRRPDMPCADCGKPMWRGTSSLPPAVWAWLYLGRLRGGAWVGATAGLTPRLPRGGFCYGTMCRACWFATRAAQSDPIAAQRRKRDQAARRRRELAAPGLSITARRRLLDTWKRQGRTCTYCDNPATQVDHVIPLALGGTHHEGNLTPCCKPCNVRKSDSLLIEWKHKRRTRRAHTQPPPLKPKRIKPTTKTWSSERPLFALTYQPRQKTGRPCVKCGQVFYAYGAQYRSKRCHPSTISGAKQRRRAQAGAHQISAA